MKWPLEGHFFYFMKLDLYYYDECPFCQLVLEAIDDLGLEAKVNLCNVRKDSKYRDYHVKTTGRTTVPCLYIDDKPMFESRDIVRWLEAHQKKISEG